MDKVQVVDGGLSEMLCCVCVGTAERSAYTLRVHSASQQGGGEGATDLQHHWAGIFDLGHLKGLR